MDSVFKYKNYRTFLRDFYLQRKSQGSFTFESFSRLAGFKSRSFLKSVIDGTRDLNSESTFKVSKAMNLDLAEQRFFEALVCENQAHSSELKTYYRATLSSFKKEASVAKTQQTQLLDFPFFLSALTLLSDHKEGLELKRFCSILSLKKELALDFLGKMVESGMVHVKNGLYFYNSRHTVFHDSKDWSHKQKRFLLQQVRWGLHKVERSYDRSKLYSHVFLGRPKSIKIYQQLILDLLNELAGQESDYESEATELFQVNLQLFEAR